MLTSLSLPLYTALATGVLIILQIALMWLVIKQRGEKEVAIGDGGVDAMQQAMRVHGNLVENAPIFLLGLALCELIEGSTIAIAIIAGVFVVARIAHAFGYSQSTGVTKGRFLGTIGTMLTMLATAGYLIYLVVVRL